jgi:hypothetical protein
MCIGTYTSADRHGIDQHLVILLLYIPLPVDLPTMQEDILILVVARHGDTNRYVRLRRPVLVEGETECLVRGIYYFQCSRNGAACRTFPG